MHIVGTAGHVDHGKSALIAALTGTNPDRWIEEQLRGMTLDLGFAHLRFGDGLEAGIVDVPGHERFLHNMLAGAAGMELLLLVVDANEGVMPQTLEHLEILRFSTCAACSSLRRRSTARRRRTRAACARIRDRLAERSPRRRHFLRFPRSPARISTSSKPRSTTSLRPCRREASTLRRICRSIASFPCRGSARS